MPVMEDMHTHNQTIHIVGQANRYVNAPWGLISFTSKQKEFHPIQRIIITIHR